MKITLISSKVSSLDVSGISDKPFLRAWHPSYLCPLLQPELGILCYCQTNTVFLILLAFRITSNCLLPRNLLKTFLVKRGC